MADLAKLVVKLEAQTSQYVSQLEKANAKLASFEAATKKSLSAIDNAFKNLVKAATVVKVTQSLVGLSDQYTQIQNRLKLVTDGTEQLNNVQNQLFESAQKTRSGFAETVNLYSRLARSSTQLGLSQKELIGITETVNKTLSISGASTQEAASTVLQFGQALASGRLAGDEFKAVLENAPRLAQAITDGLGVTLKKLYEMRTAGELTIDKVVKAIQSQVPKISDEFNKTTATISQSFITLQNAAINFFGKIGSSTVGVALASSIQLIAANLEDLTKVLLVGASAWATYRTAIAVAPLVEAAKAAIQLYSAVASGRAILLGSAAAEKAKAASALASAQAEAQKAAATLAAVKAEQSKALVVGNVTKITDAQAVSNLAAARAEHARAAAALASAKAQQSKALVLGAVTKITDADAVANLRAARAEETRAAAALAAYRAQRAVATTELTGSAAAVVARKMAKLEAEALAAKTALTAAEARLAAATVVTNDSMYARAAAAKQIAALEAEEVAAKTALTAAEARLAAATVVTNDAMYARAAAAKQVQALEAGSAAAQAALATAQARSAAATSQSTGILASLGRSLAGILAPFRALAALAAANPMAAIATGVVAATTALVMFSDKIKTSEDGIVTLRDTGIAAFQLLQEAIAPVVLSMAQLIGDVFKTGFKQWKTIFTELADAISPVTERLKSLIMMIPFVKFVADAVDKVQQRARKIAEDRLKKDFLTKLQGEADSIIGKIQGGPGGGESDSSKALESLKKLEDGLKQQIITERAGAVETIKFRIAQGDLADEFTKAGASGNKYRESLVSLTAQIEKLKIQKMVDDIRQQVSVQDLGAVSTLRYRMEQGDLKKQFDELGSSVAPLKKELLELTRVQEASKIRDVARDLEQQIATFEKSGAAVLEYRFKFGDLSKTLKDAGDAGQEFANKALEAQKALDALNVSRQLADINAQIMELRGNTAEAIVIRFDIQNQQLKNQLEESGNTAGLEMLSVQRKLIQDQAVYNKLQEESSRIKDELAAREERIQNSSRVGAISEFEALKQTGEERGKAAMQLDEINSKMRELASNSQNQAVIDGAKAFGYELENLKSQVDLVGQKVQTVFSESWADAFVDVATGAKTAGDAVTDMLQSIQRQLLEMIARNYAQKFFEGFLNIGSNGSSGGGGIVSSILGLFGGGRASGGAVEANKMYRINEHTDNSEWFIPRTAGRVVPSDKSSGQNNVFQFTVPGGESASRQTQSQTMAAAARGVALANRRNN